MSSEADLDAREAQADRAAANGDIAAARHLLEQVVATAPDRVDSWLKLAALRRAAGGLAGALAAVSSALRADPLHFVALLSKARLIEAGGDDREAGRAYMRALAQCPDAADLPQALAPLVRHAEQARRAYLDRVRTAWTQAIDADHSLSDAAQARLARFTSNALRETQVYHSEPSHYHYPGLAEREIHDRTDFPWLSTLEQATADIRAEFEALWHDHAAVAEPYVRYAADTPVRQWSSLNNSLDWTAFHLLQGGVRIDRNADRCPRTMAVLDAIDQPHIAGRSPNAMFSLLKPRTRIPPHTGIANTRLVCHLPLIVPAHCWFRVGATKAEWREGEAFVFDDTIEHEAANDGDQPRIVFIIDTWHPGLTAEERAGVVRAMEADEAENGAPL